MVQQTGRRAREAIRERSDRKEREIERRRLKCSSGIAQSCSRLERTIGMGERTRRVDARQSEQERVREEKDERKTRLRKRHGPGVPSHDGVGAEAAGAGIGAARRKQHKHSTRRGERLHRGGEEGGGEGEKERKR